MDIPVNIDMLRKQLRSSFRREYGSVEAFCREKGITSAWLRLVFSGKYEADDLLIEAADFLDRWFAVSERGSSFRTEMLGGATTFATMAYIVVVNPSILAAGHSVLDLSLVRRIRQGLDFNLAIDNVADRSYYETQNYIESRPYRDARPAFGIHATPGYPLTVTAGLTFRFRGK